MKKGLKKLLIFGGLVAAGVIVYRKSKKSEEDNFVKEVSNTIKSKVDETMKEADVKEFLNKKAKKITDELRFEKNIERLADKMCDNLIRNVRRKVFKKVTHYTFWSEWLE